VSVTIPLTVARVRPSSLAILPTLIGPRSRSSDSAALWRGPSAATALDGARRIVEEGGTNLYYEDAFARIAQYLTMRSIPTRGRVWTEVDDLVDRDRAERIAAELDARKAS